MRLFLVVAFATIATGALRHTFGGRRRGGFTSHLHANVTASLPDDSKVGVDWIDQKLDHFDSKNTKVWKQRYFFNLMSATAESNVNFLYLSGEQTAYASMTTFGAYVGYAAIFNAPIYALEHRFYGDSHPTEDTTLENLKYFSSRQAIEDIAEFIRQKNAEKGGDQKWIVVGGSYAGNLAAWSRLKHPELIAGSLASSAPVLAQLDFYGYLQTVDEVFKKVGDLCYTQISAGLEEAQKMMQSPDGRDQLSDLFKITPPLSTFDVLNQNDIETFYSILIDPFMGAAQYSNPPIKNLCQKFTANGADYDPLQAFQKIMPATMDIRFSEQIADSFDVNYKTDDRLWLYQTCTEFGYFQSTNKGTNAFGQVFSTRTFIEYCIQLFNIDADQIQKNIESTNAYYGERDYFAGTNVVFAHGTQDPWSYLAKSSDPKHWSVVIVEIQDGDHCSDIGAYCLKAGLGCTDNMKQVQQLTLENMQRWINPVFPVPDRIEITDNVGHRPNFYDGAVREVSPDDANVVPHANRAERSLVEYLHTHRINRSKWNKFTGKGRRVLPAVSGKKLELDGVTVGQDWIEQTWDHFNTNEERTFKQKWYFNYKFGSADGPESDYWVTHENLAWMTYAKEVGANVFILEHRYYGESKLGTKDLQYLTSAQMLYDVATFIRTQQTKNGLTGPWISFGGSYPGALAAWSREWFPELILGAVGSSGPVLAKNDFYEYLEVVEDVLKRQSQKCYDGVSAAIEKFRQLTLSPEGRKTLQDKFKIWPAWTGAANEAIEPLDMDTVFSGLNGIFMGTVQYNAVNWADVKAVCAPFESGQYTDPLDALRAAQVLNYNDEMETLSSFQYELSYYKIMLNFIDKKHLLITDDDLAGVLWMWQTCNEFGYYQSTDYGEGIFGTNVPLNFYVTMCEQIYGVGMDHVENGVARTNYQYGGRTRFNTTNVVLPNGDADPWHALGLLDSANFDASVVPVVIKGTSHCADMYGATKDDPAELTQARKTVLENIKKWLATAPVVPITENPSTPTKPTEATVTHVRRTSNANIATKATVPTVSTTPTTTSPPTTSQTPTSATETSTTSAASGTSLICALFTVALVSLF